MNLLPFENFYIQSHLKPEGVQQRLETVTAPQLNLKNWFDGRPALYFKGWVVNGAFEVTRVINYRNSFNPQIKGTIEPFINGTRLHIKMQVHSGVMVFISVWLFYAASSGIISLVQVLQKGQFETAMLAPFGMFLFGYTLTMGGFIYESQKAKGKICELIEGQIEIK